MDERLLADLAETSGVPGYEDRIREIVRREFDGVVDRVRTDAMGNLVGTVEGDADHAVVVSAHMDEIGFLVRNVEDGFLELDALGGWDARVLRAQRVIVHAEDGDLPGVIGAAPPHTLDEEDAEAKAEVEDVRVDLGLDADAVDERVSVGDRVTLDRSLKRVGEHVTGKAIDDRVSVYVMLEAARRIDAEATVHFAATVQEEVGMRGARALGVDLDPDLAINLDTTVANDVPGFEAGEHVTRLGEGTAIKIKDGSVITNPKIVERLRRIAAREDLPYQLEVLPSGGTDAAGFQNAYGAKPVGALSVPTRYLHTSVESVHVDDVEATTDLLVAFLDGADGSHDYTL